MARETFKREQEVLRILFLDSGAMTRRQFADRLGLSVESLDKVLAELRKALGTTGASGTIDCENGAYVLARDRSFTRTLTQNLLSILYRLKGVRQTEIERFTFIIGQLRRGDRTLPQLLNAFSDELSIELDRKTLQSYMDYLVEAGTVRCKTDARPFLYQLDMQLFDSLTDDELESLYRFVDFAANTAVLSAVGYLLQDSLGDHMRNERNLAPQTPFAYKYNYHGRILDEYVCQELLSCMAAQRKIRLEYGGKDYRRYRSKLHEPKEAAGRIVIPSRIVYDHQYGRWYLLGYETVNGKSVQQIYRFERIERLEPLEEVIEAAEQKRLLALTKSSQENSWVVSTAGGSQDEEVVVRFWFDPSTVANTVNFIRERVEREGRWGTLETETDSTFLYRIVVADHSEIKSWLLGFGSAAEVLAPELLRREICQDWQRMVERYDDV